jgi:sulfite reductase (NADPH) hemoprotein beta-component
MYQYTDFDKKFIKLRAAQYRDQLGRHLAGTLSRRGVPAAAPAKRLVHPALRTHAAHCRALWRDLQRPAARAGQIAREYDQPSGRTLLARRAATQDALGAVARPAPARHSA